MNYLRATRNWGLVSLHAAHYFSISLVGGVVSHAATRYAMRNWCRASCDSLGVPRQLINEELLEQTGQCILVVNHLSSLDILVLGSFLKRDYRWMAKKELFKVPFSGWHLHLAGHIPVDRGAGKQEEIYKSIHKVVQEGASVLFFAEGTRSRTGQLKPFKMGAFHTAIRERLPILPLVIEGTYDLMLPGAKDLAIQKNRTCTVTVKPPIWPAAPAADLSDAQLHAQAEALRAQTYRVFLEQLYPDDEAKRAQALADLG